MGGWEHIRQGRGAGRPPRRAVFAVALAVLLGALLLCVRPGEPHASAASPAAVAAPVTASPAAVAAPVTAAPAAVTAAPAPHGPRHAVCADPGHRPGCSPFSHVTPAVLPAPPPALPVTPGAADPAGQAAAGRGARPYDAPARAPDLHALQVLRT
ncbi:MULTISPECIES: hypothetical protein [Streptomyces]|uniref:hypothetical protein n=1 Tax=Streptomyces TaxID=1883 RepID=UPI00167BFB15|nr:MULTISPECIES: hypothetical protein [Streptomyces]MBD3578388.1 hypothetical protein [Streptomyces sp. KD18]GGT11011.1 hypothetical protein GCM10010286_40760 [Streptomyces toxytricini]